VLTRKTELLLSFQPCCLPDDALKQKILSDAEKNKNKVIVVYDAATGERNVVVLKSTGQP
jgi:hypothetical protein